MVNEKLVDDLIRLRVEVERLKWIIEKIEEVKKSVDNREELEKPEYYDVERDEYIVEHPSYYYGYVSPEREKLAFEDYLRTKEE